MFVIFRRDGVVDINDSDLSFTVLMQDSSAKYKEKYSF